MVKLLTLISPPSSLVAWVKTPNRYPVKNCHEFAMDAVPSLVNVFPSKLYEKVAVRSVLELNAGVISASILNQTSSAAVSVGPVAATVPLEDVVHPLWDSVRLLT